MLSVAKSLKCLSVCLSGLVCVFVCVCIHLCTVANVYAYAPQQVWTGPIKAFPQPEPYLPSQSHDSQSKQSLHKPVHKILKLWTVSLLIHISHIYLIHIAVFQALMTTWQTASLNKPTTHYFDLASTEGYRLLLATGLVDKYPANCALIAKATHDRYVMYANCAASQV